MRLSLRRTLVLWYKLQQSQMDNLKPVLIAVQDNAGFSAKERYTIFELSHLDECMLYYP